jgi:hypothetical protein
VIHNEYMRYRYKHFYKELLIWENAFRGGYTPGDKLPEFSVFDLSGSSQRISHLTELKPTLFSLGSITCPMTITSLAELKTSYQKYSEKLNFISVYVHEAHPGELYEQPLTLDEKIAHAIDFKKKASIPGKWWLMI